MAEREGGNQESPDFNRLRQRIAPVERKISGVSESDIRVAVIARVIDKDPFNSRITIDDGSGTIKSVTVELKEVGRIVRVIGRPFKAEDEICIDSESIQEFDDFDFELLDKVRELESRILEPILTECAALRSSMEGEMGGESIGLHDDSEFRGWDEE